MRDVGIFGAEAARDLAQPRDLARAVLAPGPGLPWRSGLPVGELALDSVALVSGVLAAAAHADGDVVLDPAAIAASFGSERVVRVGGAAPTVWAPLSGFWRARDGWVRTHANYPHHAARLTRILGLREDADRDAAAAAIAQRDALELEAAAIDADAIVAAVRTAEEWAAHPQAAVVRDLPLVGLERTGDAAPRAAASEGAPLAGVRVLDLTRVIAGPVATRDLALAGADVLRVDSPRLVEPEWQLQDTGQGKRATLLDLDDAADRRAFDELLARADVLVTGYRPGALDRYGLAPADLARTHPGLVVSTLSAWGTTGPWGGRRGFDSIVQATIGIAAHEAVDGVPGALPVQALDHASGHLLAAGTVAALARRRAEGGSWHVSVALARTGAALLAAPGRTDPHGDLSDLPSIVLGSGASALTCAPPALGFPGAPRSYPDRVPTWGGDGASWRA